jgi:hypothetical protein
MKYIFYYLIVSSLFFTGISAQELNIENEMVNQISLLGEENSFAYVDLKLTSEELDLIDQLKFDQLPEGASVQYDRFGDLHLLKEELTAFLKSIGNDNPDVISIVAEVISKTTREVVSASNKESAWVCVRASRPNTNFDIPRWHMDGAYYGLNGPYPYPELVFKFAATLKGSPTLLYNLTQDQRDVFNTHWNDRQFLSEFLDLSKAESPKRGEGVFFIVANHQIAAAHSEPPMDSNRLFFSILVGNKSEIEELYLRWHPQNSSSN